MKDTKTLEIWILIQSVFHESLIFWFSGKKKHQKEDSKKS